MNEAMQSILINSRRAGLSRTMQVFGMVCASESFTKASKVLHMTQPAVSFQVSKVETEWGCQLINRYTDGRLTLTEQGSAIYSHILKMAKSCVEFEKYYAKELAEKQRVYTFDELDTLAQYAVIQRYKDNITNQKLVEMVEASKSETIYDFLGDEVES